MSCKIVSVTKQSRVGYSHSYILDIVLSCQHVWIKSISLEVFLLGYRFWDENFDYFGNIQCGITFLFSYRLPLCIL